MGREKERDREVEGDGKKRRAHCSKSMKTGRWMERQQIKKIELGMRKTDL